MSMAYDPTARKLSVEYMVSTTGDRWFIPVNSNDTMANQLAECNKLVGKDASDADVGSEEVV